MEYPKPDRSEFVPNLEKADMEDVLDLGWSKGQLRDGRPFRVECWAQHGVTLLTWFFSVLGLESCNDTDLINLLMSEGLLEIIEGREPGIRAERITDVAGNDMWSLNVVIGDDDGIRMRDRHLLQRYAD